VLRAPDAVVIGHVDPAQPHIEVRPRAQGDLRLVVDIDNDGRPELDDQGSRRVAATYFRSCRGGAFAPEYRTIHVSRQDDDPSVPLVSVDRYDDGNLRIVVDDDLDGRAEVDVTTDLEFERAPRSPACSKSSRAPR